MFGDSTERKGHAVLNIVKQVYAEFSGQPARGREFSKLQCSRRIIGEHRTCTGVKGSLIQ